MQVIPDPATAWIDPFYSHKTLSLICSIQEPRSGQPYARCPRSLAQKALEYLGSTGIADTAYFGPEPEFFVFDDVRYTSGSGSSLMTILVITARVPSSTCTSRQLAKRRTMPRRHAQVAG